MLRSLLRPRRKSIAVPALMTMPMAATIITSFPATGSGSKKRWIAPSAIAPVATSRNTALNNAARMDVPRRP